MGIITEAQQQQCLPRPGAQHFQAQHGHVVPTDLEVPALGPGRILYLQRSVNHDHKLPYAMVPLHLLVLLVNDSEYSQSARQ